MQVADAAPAPVREHRMHWWKEALIVAVFYGIYSWTRNLFGSNKIAADGIPEQAFTNAERIIQWELNLNLFHEQTVQSWFLPYDWFIKFWNTYYGTAHFIVTLAVFVLLYLKRADVFPQWRNSLAAMTALAIIGFAWFPLMPPRLLDEPCPIPAEIAEETGVRISYGGACIESDLRPDGGLGFVDTLAELRRSVVVRLRDDGIDLESVRRNAEPAHRLVDVVRDCDLAAPATHVGQGARVALPRRHVVLHRGDGQPLLARRGGWTRRVRGRLAHRVGAAPLEPGSARPSPRRTGRRDLNGAVVTVPRIGRPIAVSLSGQ